MKPPGIRIAKGSHLFVRRWNLRKMSPLLSQERKELPFFRTLDGLRKHSSISGGAGRTNIPGTIWQGDSAMTHSPPSTHFLSLIFRPIPSCKRLLSLPEAFSSPQNALKHHFQFSLKTRSNVSMPSCGLPGPQKASGEGGWKKRAKYWRGWHFGPGSRPHWES